MCVWCATRSLLTLTHERRAKIEFAKKLVQRLCREDGNEAELPLGDASIKRVRVPANTIGKVIGRKVR